MLGLGLGFGLQCDRRLSIVSQVLVFAVVDTVLDATF